MTIWMTKWPTRLMSCSSESNSQACYFLFLGSNCTTFNNPKTIHNPVENLVLIAYRNIGIILGFSAVFLVFSSNLVMNMNSEHFILGAPKFDKDVDKFVKKLKDRIKDQIDDHDDDDEKDDDEKDDDEKDDDEKDDDDEKEVKTNYDYTFVDEGDIKRKDFNFAAAGDFGCSQNTKNTISNMLDKKPELVLPLGDLSVDQPANCWLDLISPFDDRLKITFGYDEVKDGQSKLNQYREAFGLDELYSSFNYRGVHFIIMSTLSDYNVTSDQYKFIEKDLKETSENQNIDWIVVTNYGPFYTSPSTHPAKNDIRNIYHPLFDRYGVDLVLHGHNHNYQRTYPVTFNADKGSKPTVTNAFTTGYEGNKDGIVYAIVGTGGEGFHPLEGRQSYVANQFGDKFGFLDIEISNGNPHTKLTGTFYDNKGSNVTDHFTIEKEIKNTDVDIQPDALSASASQNSNPNHDYLPFCNYCDK